MTFLDSLESVLWVEEARGRDGCSERWLSWLSLSDFRSSRCSVGGLLNVSLVLSSCFVIRTVFVICGRLSRQTQSVSLTC
jgi:hypothetical protein